ncbi:MULTISPECIES: SDR family NAD(P)-dependent oxidoreductase [Paenibacillus]|uniref:SDR family NAD(P)-dependent oxidoreductase n=1 Tax=Paenibacillus TaxID=44249 RepID=UPI002FE0F39B
MDIRALVTGADHGVGLALAETLLEQGGRVFAGRYNPRETALDELSRRYPDRLTTVSLDIGSDDSVREAAETVEKLTGRLDLLINNAGILGDTEATIREGKMDFEEMLKVYNVNTLGALRVTKAFLSLLLKGEARMIANISSEAGSIGQNKRSGWFAYCMSKAALNMQSSLVFNGIKEAGGRVLVIHPGWVRTYMRGELDAAADLTPAESAENIISLIRERMRRSAEGARNGEQPEYIDAYGAPLPW